MMDTRFAALIKQICLRLIAALAVVGMMLFVPAGSFSYWEGWVFMGVIFVPPVCAVAYFLKKDPGLLERRMKLNEKEGEQRTIVTISAVIFFIGFLFPGLDHRFQWSAVPVALVLAANAIVFVGYLLVFLTLRENSYASRIIEVAKDQKVISTGPYAYVRHPMYLGAIVMALFTPLALGSYWSVIPFLILPVFIVFRILNEEKVLARDLPGYQEYCGKVRYRLVPGVW